MNVRFFLEHQNSKLFQIYILQAVVIISVFALFFYSVGFTFYFALLAAVIGFLTIACLYRWMNMPFFILPMIKGAVYIPTTDEDIATMLKLVCVKQGERVVDLGSGDGRVVAAFAKAGANAEGIELNPALVARAEELLKVQKVSHTKILWQSFWDADLSSYDVIVLYGYPTIMKNLKKKLDKELKPGTRIVSNQFSFPGWKSEKEYNGVYLYLKQ